MNNQEVPPFITGGQKARELATLFSDGSHLEMIETSHSMTLEEAQAAAEYLAAALVSSLRVFVGPVKTDEYLKDLWAEWAIQDEEDLRGFHDTVEMIMSKYGVKGEEE